MTTSINPYINLISALCSDLVTLINQVPVVGSIVGLFVAGYCDVTTAFISLFPLQAFGLVVPSFIG